MPNPKIRLTPSQRKYLEELVCENLEDYPYMFDLDGIVDDLIDLCNKGYEYSHMLFWNVVFDHSAYEEEPDA